MKKKKRRRQEWVEEKMKGNRRIKEAKGSEHILPLTYIHAHTHTHMSTHKHKIIPSLSIYLVKRKLYKDSRVLTLSSDYLVFLRVSLTR